MKTIIELILQLAGGIVLLCVTGWVFALKTGYDEYYDKMLNDEDETKLTIKNINTDNDDYIHHLKF